MVEVDEVLGAIGEDVRANDPEEEKQCSGNGEVAGVTPVDIEVDGAGKFHRRQFLGLFLDGRQCQCVVARTRCAFQFQEVDQLVVDLWKMTPHQFSHVPIRNRLADIDQLRQRPDHKVSGDTHKDCPEDNHDAGSHRRRKAKQALAHDGQEQHGGGDQQQTNSPSQDLVYIILPPELADMTVELTFCMIHCDVFILS